MPTEPLTQIWPKKVPALTPEQHRIQEDWIHHWLNVLPKRYGRIERFNHTYPARHTNSRGRTLEIGAGLGEHIHYEDLSQQEYYALELRQAFAAEISEEFPTVKTIVGDCQVRLPFEDQFFDRVLAIHVLEHLPNLPAALEEIARVLRPSGRFAFVIPCEGGLLHSLGRRFTVKRMFEKRYGVSYDWHIKSEHLNIPKEILRELQGRFNIQDRAYFPFRLPLVDMNALLGVTASPRPV